MAELAFEILYDGVKAKLAEDGNTCAVVFGQREVAKRINGGPGQANRVVFAPGDEKGAIGEYGEATKARLPSFQNRSTPRTLFTLGELFRVYCWAFDSSDPENELAQYRAARFLHDQVVRALYHAGHGTFILTKPTIVPIGVERKFGCEIVINLTIIAKLPDDPGPVADPDFATVKPTTGIGPSILEKVPPGTEDGEDTTHGT